MHEMESSHELKTMPRSQGKSTQVDTFLCLLHWGSLTDLYYAPLMLDFELRGHLDFGLGFSVWICPLLNLKV